MRTLHIFQTSFVAICVGMALLCASCATGAKKETEKKSPKEIAQLHTDLGTQALVRGEFALAIEDLRKAISIDDQNTVAHNHLGLAYYGIGKKDLAKAEIQKAISIDESYSDAYINLGNLAFEDKNYDLAKHYNRKALDNLAYKMRHRALTNLAQLALRENKTDEARQLLYQSLQLNPDFCMSHFLLGTILMRENNSKRAVGEFKRSVASTCIKNIEGHYQLGLAYLKSRDYDKARSQFVFLLEQFPQSLQAQHAGDHLRNIP